LCYYYVIRARARLNNFRVPVGNTIRLTLTRRKKKPEEEDNQFNNSIDDICSSPESPRREKQSTFPVYKESVQSSIKQEINNDVVSDEECVVLTPKVSPKTKLHKKYLQEEEEEEDVQGMLVTLYYYV
jgi:hypothetical protein